jgi:hypothetical protein
MRLIALAALALACAACEQPASDCRHKLDRLTKAEAVILGCQQMDGCVVMATEFEAVVNLRRDALECLAPREVE